jgi:hypothetical protein
MAQSPDGKLLYPMHEGALTHGAEPDNTEIILLDIAPLWE